PLNGHTNLLVLGIDVDGLGKLDGVADRPAIELGKAVTDLESCLLRRGVVYDVGNLGDCPVRFLRGFEFHTGETTVGDVASTGPRQTRQPESDLPSADRIT